MSLKRRRVARGGGVQRQSSPSRDETRKGESGKRKKEQEESL